MNTSLVNLSDDEITIKFEEAVESARGGDMKPIATLMADFNALQRPDDDPLKTALLKTSGLLMGGQVEALAAHQDTRKGVELLMHWVAVASNPKQTKAQLRASLQSVAVYFLSSSKHGEFKKLIEFVKDVKDSGVQEMLNSLTGTELQKAVGKVVPAEIAKKAATHIEASRRKPRAPRKKKAE